MAYREAPTDALKCPRCRAALPPLEIAACRCGTWVTALAAKVALTAADRHPDPGTRWWKVRPPCPMCGEQMHLCGDEPGHLVGCEGHGYWIDADAHAHTGLAKPVDAAALQQLHDSDEARQQAQAEREAAETDRARAHADKERAEATVRTAIVPARAEWRDDAERVDPSRLTPQEPPASATRARAKAPLTSDAQIAALETRVNQLELLLYELIRKHDL